MRHAVAKPAEPGQGADVDIDRLHGDVDYFDALVRRFSARVFTFVRAHAESDDEAYDLLQETWLRAFRGRKGFHGRGSWLAWLLAIGHSACMDGHRRVARDDRRRVTLEEAHHSEAAGQAASELDTLVTRERSARVICALTDLPQRQRETVILRLMEGRSTREAARILGCAEGTVRAALHAGVRHLRRILHGNDT